MTKLEYYSKGLFALICGAVLVFSFFNPWAKGIAGRIDTFINLPVPKTESEMKDYCQRARNMVVAYHAAVKELTGGIRLLMIVIMVMTAVDFFKERQRRWRPLPAGAGNG